ncbi:MAG: hypothetical protein LBS92_07190 [Candidatus Methanoplasma sp.]|jgi:hypothetical protein|nr:hypothetical protein [Candidatus Methanoplasma sp.]
MKAPRSAAAGVVLGLLGGILSFAFMAFLFEAGTDAVSEVGSYMLLAVLFFAIAGAFTANSQWSWDMLLFMSFLTATISVVFLVVEAVDLYAGVIALVMVASIIAVLLSPSSRIWLDRPRI